MKWNMTNKNIEEIVEEHISDVHKVFYELLKIYNFDPVEHRKAVENGVEEVLKNRAGWVTVTPHHFAYKNGLNIFIDPVTPPNTWGLISETAKRVLRIELEEWVKGTPKEETALIQKATEKLIKERDWSIVFNRRKLK